MMRWTRKKLLALSVPAILIPGFLAAMFLGWRPNQLIFTQGITVKEVIDGDTLILKNGREVRLLAINAPERGAKNFEKAKDELNNLIENKKIFLEYDRYQDDKYGRILAWVWVDCESEPNFLPADYMHLNKRQSRPGLKENPEGCKEGRLVNEELIKSGLAEIEIYKDRGELKYEARLTQD